MQIDRINKLISHHGFAFQAWDDRYCKGVWTALAPTEMAIDSIRDASSDEDCVDAESVAEYILSTSWLPIVTGHSFSGSLELLEDRLATLPPDMLSRNSIWSGAVLDALAHLHEVRFSIERCGALGAHLEVLPASFDEVVSVGGKIFEPR